MGNADAGDWPASRGKRQRRDNTIASSLHYRLGLLRGLLSGERAHVGPLYVHIDVTHRCNLRCRCCRWHSPLVDSRRDKGIVEDICPDVFSRLCDDLYEMGTRLMFFVGTGEPLLHPRAFDLIKTAKSKGFELIMYTNGTMLTEETLGKLIDLRLDVLRVSLWSGTEEGFAEEVGVEAASRFRDVVEGMKRLTRLKRERNAGFPLLELCQSVTQRNTNDLERVVPLAQECGCDRLCFSPLVDFGEDTFRRFQPSTDDCRSLGRDLAKMKPRLAALSIENNIDTMLLHYRTEGGLWQQTPCYPAWFFSYIRSDGKVFLCQRNGKTTPSLGDLRENRFAEIWNNDLYRQARRMASQCGGSAAHGQYFCPFCSHSMNTYKVHRHFRFLRPAARLLGRICR